MNNMKMNELLKMAAKMKRYHRFRIVHQHYSRYFERKKLKIQKQLPYTPNRELFEAILPYVYKGEIPPIIWGGSSFQYRILLNVGDPFYTYLNEYSCFGNFCCNGDEVAEAELLIILNQLYTIGIVFIPTGTSIRAVITWDYSA